ncbi:hypothetical protein B4135_3574 [Caldibacillus debilis]|uniref:Uncharacterized protein n=1 Tax=Caldibacillus debilis TaxID=301148 RepID=A0A150LEG0_9BACI|nr:hypothetical protein B4135_3574 [Caldibacillus debilis]
MRGPPNPKGKAGADRGTGLAAKSGPALWTKLYRSSENLP